MSQPLEYQSVVDDAVQSRRPLWVKLIVAVYLLLMLAFLAGPFVLSIMSDTGDRASITLVVGSAVSLMVLSGLALILIPVRVRSRRPIARGHILWPVVGSGAMIGLLAIGAALSVDELLHRDWWQSEAAFWSISGAGAIVWAIWSVVFAIAVWSNNPASFSQHVHRKLIAGSVLELLVAVPSHVIVRQRTECCAGFYTGAGICVGVAVLFVAFGPSVLLLYWRRFELIRPKPV